MINQEEYEVLKELDGKWKWLARDEDGVLYTYNNKPNKWVSLWMPVNILGINIDRLFEFIQWTDSEPYFIPDLIWDYENSAENISHVVNERVKALGKAWRESEDEEVKDKKWLKEKVRDIARHEGDERLYINMHTVLELIDQLDEPETLSQEWIDEHVDYADVRGGTQSFVRVDDLQNILVPKQEKVVVPQFVAEWYEENQEILSRAISNLIIEEEGNFNRKYSDFEKWFVYDEVDTMETLFKMKIFGYELEKEPKFYVLDNEERPLLIKFFQGVMRAPSDIDPIGGIEKNHRDNVQFTEQEIKDYDERFLPFKVPVGEVPND